jgi:CRP-like cAMP-binding protein
MSSLGGWDERDGIELFQRLPLFRPLTFEETRTLASISHYLIVSGTVLVTRDAPASDSDGVTPRTGPEIEVEVSLGRLTEGEMFGEMSLVDDELTSARVTALENVQLLVLPRGELEALMASDQALSLKIYQAFCKNLCARLRRANPRLPATEALKLGVY